MTKRETVSNIFKPITKQIEIFDFKVDLKNQWFVRKTSNCFFVYDIHFYNRTNIETGAKGFLVEPYIWVNVRDGDVTGYSFYMNYDRMKKLVNGESEGRFDKGKTVVEAMVLSWESTNHFVRGAQQLANKVLCCKPHREKHDSEKST